MENGREVWVLKGMKCLILRNSRWAKLKKVRTLAIVRDFQGYRRGFVKMWIPREWLKTLTLTGEPLHRRRRVYTTLDKCLIRRLFGRKFVQMLAGRVEIVGYQSRYKGHVVGCAVVMNHTTQQTTHYRRWKLKIKYRDAPQAFTRRKMKDFFLAQGVGVIYTGKKYAKTPRPTSGDRSQGDT